MMTSHAAEFVSPLTFTTLSSHPCEVDLFDPSNPDPIAHISLAKWADLVLLIPCTANVLAKSCMALVMIWSQRHFWPAPVQNG